MFRLEQAQIQAFRSMMRARIPGDVLNGLRQQGWRAEREPGTGDVVCTDARGFQSRLAFQADGLPSRLTSPSGNALGLEHDAQGRLAALVHPGSQRLEMERDSNGNITVLRRPGLLSYTLQYDEKDRPLVINYPDGTTTRFTWHPAGPLASVTDRCGAMTRYERDEKGRLLAIIDPLNRRTEYITDEDGFLEAVVFPDGTRQQHAVDPETALACVVLRGGGLVLHDVGEVGEALQSITWPDGTRTEFELQGERLLQARNQADTLSSTSDAHGNPLTEKSSAGTVRYEYDAEGRLIRLVTHWGDVLEYEYDCDGRLCKVRDWQGRENRVAYASDGSVSEISYGNGLLESQWRARTGRLGRARVVSPSGRLLSEQHYEYDLCERLTGIRDFQTDGYTLRASRSFAYDAEGRLLGEQDRLTGRQMAVFGYDAKGNLVEDCGAPVQVGLLDEPLCHGPHRIEYDADGNMIRLPGPQGELRCNWGSEGLLRQVRYGGRTVRFEYDALGRRVLKTDGTTTWRYGWAGHQLLWEEVEHYPGAQPVRRDYLFLPETVIPLAFREGGRTCWLQADARGAIIRAFDEAGHVVWRASYDSFGAVHVELALVRQPWRLAGQYEDEETGLYYNLARYYYPWLKSYLSRDPRWYEPEATNYSYCRNDPWNRADPFGGLAPLLALGVAGLVGAAVGAITAAAMGGDPVAGAVGGFVAGAGSVIAVVAGASAGVILAAGVVATGVGAFAEALVEQANRGDGFCLKCALMSAGAAALTDLALFGLGRIPGVRALVSALGRRLAGARRALSRHYYKLRGKLYKKLRRFLWQMRKRMLARLPIQQFRQRTERLSSSQRGAAFEAWMRRNQPQFRNAPRHKFSDNTQVDRWINSTKRQVWEFKHFQDAQLNKKLSGHSKGQLAKYSKKLKTGDAKEVNYVFSSRPGPKLAKQIQKRRWQRLPHRRFGEHGSLLGATHDNTDAEESGIL